VNANSRMTAGMLLLCCCCWLGCAASARAAEEARLEGRWEGEVIVTPGEYEVPLAIEVTREGSRLKGSLSLPLRNIKGIALKEASLEGNSVFLVQAEKEGDYVFMGKLAEDGKSIAGSRTYHGDSYPFHLVRLTGPERQPEIKPLAESGESLRAQFNADRAKARLVVVLAPTCPTCRISAHLLEKYVLDAIDDDQLRVYVVWQPVFSHDSRDAVGDAAALLPDARVTHFWTESVATMAFYKSFLKLDHPAFDVVFLYPPGASWDAAWPVPLFYMHRLESSGLPKENLINGPRLAGKIRTVLSGAGK
jgi:hypothetical protein